jgi:SAM-dependent methyltransferase
VKNGYSIHRCAVCEVAFLTRPPAPDLLPSLYSVEYFTEGGAGYRDYNGDERAHRRQARNYLQKLSKLGIAPGSLIDIGCASGFFLDEARQQGWKVSGCDFSEYAHRHAQRDLGLDVALLDFLDPRYSPSDQSVDVITMFNVLEHLHNPTGVAAKVFRLLRPGGHLVLETWDPQSLFARMLGPHWPTYAPPTVLHCFTKRTLGRLFDRDRWSLLVYRSAAKWISLEHGLSLLEFEARNSRWIAGALRAARKSRIGRMSVPYALGDLIFAVIQKKPRSESASMQAD